MRKRLRDKNAGMKLLFVLIIISLTDILFRAAALGDLVLTTSNLGEQFAVIVLALTIMILTARGKHRASYICYAVWIAYFVLDQVFELPGTVIAAIPELMAENSNILLFVGRVLRFLSMIGVIAIGVLLVEYMSDGTIYNHAFNELSVITILLIFANIIVSILAAIFTDEVMSLLDTFNSLYRLTMIYLSTFFAYDSAKMQLKKTNFS